MCIRSMRFLQRSHIRTFTFSTENRWSRYTIEKYPILFYRFWSLILFLYFSSALSVIWLKLVFFYSKIFRFLGKLRPSYDCERLLRPILYFFLVYKKKYIVVKVLPGILHCTSKITKKKLILMIPKYSNFNNSTGPL